MSPDNLETIDLPGKDEFRDQIGQNSLREKIYEDMVALVNVINEYEQPIAFEYLLHRAHADYGYSIDPESENSFSKHKARLDKLAQYEVSVYSRVVGRIPKASTWIDLALERIDGEEVTPDNLNEVQKTCTEMGEERADAYYNATKRELQERVLRDIDLGEYERKEKLANEIVEKATSKAVGIIPQRQESMRQGGQSSAGNANEKIASRALEHHGLRKGERGRDCDFTVSTGNDADLIVYGSDDEEIPVEIKSTSARERVGRAAPNDDEYWVLFGFFRDASEVRNGILFENDQTPEWSSTTDVAYAPPETVAAIGEIDSKRDDARSAYHLRNEDDKLYLRANNLFPKDMASLSDTGELTDAEPTHEKKFL